MTAVPRQQEATRQKCSLRQVNMTISLAFFATNLIKASVEGRLPRGIGVEQLRNSAAEWSRQFETVLRAGERLRQLLIANLHATNPVAIAIPIPLSH